MIKAKSQFKRRSTANNVDIMISVPSDADSPKFKTTVGYAKYIPENNHVVWHIKSFPVSIIVPGEKKTKQKTPFHISLKPPPLLTM